LAFLALCIAANVHGQGLSRHCRAVEDSNAFIRDGDFSGTFRIKMTFRQQVSGAPMEQTITGDGTFDLSIDGMPLFDGRTKDLSKFKGSLKTTTKMSWSPKSLQASQALAGSADLTEDSSKGNARSGNSFKVQGPHRIAGSVTGTTPYGGGSKPQEFQDDVTLEFTAASGSCMEASGTISSRSLSSMADMMRESGFEVVDFTTSWDMHRTDDLAARERTLRAELDKAAPAGIHRTRDAEATRLASLADGIREAPQKVQDCLFEVWKEGARKIYGRWVEEDAGALAAFGKLKAGGRVYNANSWSEIERLVRQALWSDRALALMGLDTCTRMEHTRLWQEINGRIDEYLEQMSAAKAPIVNLLAVLRSAEVLGEVSPGLREQVYSAVLRLGVQQADRTWAALLAAYNTAKRRANATASALPVRPVDDPAVRAALHAALVAENAAVMVGATLHRAADFPASAGG
jgi:hypothetical protein